jgi:hypothetical protein
MSLVAAVGVVSARTVCAQAPAKKPASAKRPLTQTDIQKLWAGGDDTLLANEIRLRGLAFTPTGEWIDVELPKLTGKSPSDLPHSVSALRQLVPAPLDLDRVSKEAPDLLEHLKAAAQKRSEAELAPLVDSTLLATKAKIYDLFDISNFRAYTLGKPAESEHGDVGMPFFELTNSNVEKLYYLYFTQSKGKIVVKDIVTGDAVAALYLHDEELLAKSKLEVMFRALNDGDQSGLKQLCSPGLYESIQKWGGVKHPGDRLARGRILSQVAVQTAVQSDQKSIRVVSKISYPLSASSNVIFFVDFERIGNDLRIVRIRDNENKVVVFDPNIDNYLNERYGIPDGPPLQETDVAMTDEDFFLPLDQLRAKARRVLQYHDLQKINDLARLFVESDPTSGEGYGIRAAADLLLHKYEDADRDAHRALELNGTAYFVLDRYSRFGANPFTPVVLAISKSTIEYLPSPGAGSPEQIPLQSVSDMKFTTGRKILNTVFSEAGPFVKLQFKAADGKKNVDYDFADFGTTCPGNVTPQSPHDLIQQAVNGSCGTTSTNGQPSGAVSIPVLTPQGWHEDLAVVSELVVGLRGGGHR